MRKYFTWMGIIAVMALMLYDLKYSARTAQNETTRLEQELIKERRRLIMVELEWTRLSRPERISALAEKYLTLKPIHPPQIMVQDEALWKAAYVSAQEGAHD